MPKNPTEMQVNKASSLLRMGLKDYESMRSEAETLAKKLIADRNNGRVDVNATSDKLQSLVASLRASEADIQRQLTVLREAAVSFKKMRDSEFEATEKTIHDLEPILKKMEVKRKHEEDILRELETAEGATISSSYVTQMYYTKLILYIIGFVVFVAGMVFFYSRAKLYLPSLTKPVNTLKSMF